MTSLSRVVIVDYDPAWPWAFEAEAGVLREAAGPGLARVEHTGSTSVPGLAAKPIIDILGGVGSVDELDALAPRFRSVGYEYVPQYEDVMPERRYFRKPAKGGPEPVRFHLHVVAIGSDFWNEQIAFRDYLRGHPDVASEYAALKRELAEIYVGERRGDYSDAKTDFVRGVLAKASKEAGDG